MAVNFYEEVEDSLLRFAVILTTYKGKLVLCKHKQRDTLEIPGGRREAGETIEETARRELYEETGATEYTIRPVCVYSVIHKDNFGGEESFGMLFYAEAKAFDPELHFEIKKLVIASGLPDGAAWTYPYIQPFLLEEAKRRGICILDGENTSPVQGAEITGKLRNMASVFLTKGDRMLLLYRQGGRVVNDVWVGSAGGHFEREELNDAKACMLRELHEELGLVKDDLENLRLRYITLRHIKGEIRQNYYFFAELRGHDGETFASDEGTLRWFELGELASVEMPFSQRFVMDHYLAVGRYNDALYGGIADGKTIRFVEMGR